MQLQAPLAELFEKSKVLVLDFAQIAPDAPEAENIQKFFRDSEADGQNPRLPENRQQFNDKLLAATNMRYLVSRYGEDRMAMLAGSHIAQEGRTLHMGIDIFAKNQETVYAPCDGVIVRAAREPEDHSFGYYVVLQSKESPDTYVFLGHLSKELPKLGPVTVGQPIARLGDYHDGENGGWSRHLHLQIIRGTLADEGIPQGYATRANFTESTKICPDPMPYFTSWHLADYCSVC